MKTWFDIVVGLLDEPDSCSLVVLIALLAFVGSHMVASREDLRAWGYRLAALSFIGYGVFAVWKDEPESADRFLFAAVTALLCAGLTLGISWIVLAVAGFLYQNSIGRFRTWAENASRERESERRKRESEQLRQLREEEARRAEQSIPVEVLPRSERIRQGIQQAKIDHDAECTLLQASGLDVDELEMALLDARTRYLRAIKEAMQ